MAHPICARFALATALATLTLHGCAKATWPFRPEMSSREVDLLGPHQITAFKDGDPIDITRYAARREHLDTPTFREKHISRILDGIDTRALALGDRDTLRILLFVHGGMNGYSADFERLRTLLGLPSVDGLVCRDQEPKRPADECPPLFPQTSYYPIFINWNSAPFNSIIDDVVFIRYGKRSRLLGPLTSPFVFAGRLTQGVFGAGSAIPADTQNIVDGLGRVDTSREGVPGDAAQAVGLSPLRIVTAPLLQSFGTPAWDNMKRRAELLFASRLVDPEVKATEGAARTLITSLRERITLDDRNKPFWHARSRDGAGRSVPVELTLVGHSMGAIVLDHLLAAAHTLPVRGIVYLAPASSIDDFETIVLPYLAHQPEAEFWNFTLDPRDEALEPSGLVFPPGSLLVWIDEFFEKLGTPGQKRFGRRKNLDEYLQRRAGEVVPRVHISTFEHGDAEAPHKHGQFDDPPYLRRILCLVDEKAFLDRATCAKYREAPRLRIEWRLHSGAPVPELAK